MFYEFIGKITVIAVTAVSVLLVVSLLLGVLLIKKEKLVLPRLLLFTVDTFYMQLKKLAVKFGLGERIVDQIGVEVRNNLTLTKFASTKPEDRILVVPQCLRHAKCPARLDSKVGVTCKGCGLCVIKDLKKEAEKLGYGFYIVPGGSFVQRIVKEVKPGAALGVACAKDLNIAMHDISAVKTAVQGVPLVKEGCIHTAVDVKELIRRLHAGISKVDAEHIGCEADSGGVANARG